MKASYSMRKVKDQNIVENSCCFNLQSHADKKKTMIGEQNLIISANITKEDHEENLR